MPSEIFANRQFLLPRLVGFESSLQFSVFWEKCRLKRNDFANFQSNKILKHLMQRGSKSLSRKICFFSFFFSRNTKRSQKGPLAFLTVSDHCATLWKRVIWCLAVVHFKPESKRLIRQLMVLRENQWKEEEWRLLTEDSLNRNKTQVSNFTAFAMEVLLYCFKSVMALMSFPGERHSPQNHNDPFTSS